MVLDGLRAGNLGPVEQCQIVIFVRHV
jgi:hypothetical protein